MMQSVLSFISAFALTVLIECGLALLFRSRRLVYAVFLCNLLTNPLLNFILMLYYACVGRNGYWMAVAVLEIGVVIAEAFAIKAMMRYTLRKAAMLSVLFNGCSLAAGLMMAI